MRILFVCMAHSVHAARWIGQLADTGWDLHVFPVEDGVHADLERVTLHEVLPLDAPERARLRVRHPEPLSIHGRRWARRVLGLSERVRNRARDLARVVKRLRPDVVHSLELIKAGGLVRDALSLTGRAAPPWIATNWGSELYAFARLPEFRGGAESVLRGCRFYWCECQRDVDLAMRHGFRGQVLPPVPVGGGLRLDTPDFLGERPPASRRRTVALKGYHGWAGRALVGLRALRRVADVLGGYRVVVYLADPVVDFSARLLREETELELEVLPPVARSRVLALHGAARVSIGLSMSDGISQSVLEAMAMGAFPVQSDTSGAQEWLENGRQALFVPPEDEQEVARALRRALTDDELVDRAAAANALVIRDRFEYETIRRQVIEIYRRVASGTIGHE